MNLQYVNPKSHLQLLSTIVESDQANFRQKLDSAIALSIRIDGSVDTTQIDKIYVLLKILTIDDDSELIFLGIGEQTERCAIGIFKEFKQGVINNIGGDLYNQGFS